MTRAGKKNTLPPGVSKMSQTIDIHLDDKYRDVDRETQLQIRTMACVGDDIAAAAEMIPGNSYTEAEVAINRFARIVADGIQQRIDDIYLEELGR